MVDHAPIRRALKLNASETFMFASPRTHTPLRPAFRRVLRRTRSLLDRGEAQSAHNYSLFRGTLEFFKRDQGVVAV